MSLKRNQYVFRMTFVLLFAVLPGANRSNAGADTIELMPGCLAGSTEWSAFNHTTNESHSDQDFGAFCWTAQGGGGQTGGGVDGVVFLEVSFELGLVSVPNSPSRLTIQVEGTAWVNIECCEGGIFASIGGVEVVEFWVSETTPYYITGNDPEFVPLYSLDDGTYMPMQGVLEPGLYWLDAVVSNSASTSNPGPNDLFKAWRLVFAKPGDLNGDGVVGVADLLQLLAAWGPCNSAADCLADVDGDGTVGVSDLLILLANWA